MILIDGQNFYFGLRAAIPSKNVRFDRFAELLVAGRELVHTRYYNVHLRQEAEPARYQRHERFLDAISSLPYFHVFCGRMVDRPWGAQEKGVDVQLAVDMVKHAYLDNYDTAILVSGDGDFDHAVQAVVDRGKHVENAYFKVGRSRVLINCCSRFVELTEEFMRDCLVQRPEQP
jgi:uncharacterized LabA/DUF88 family protein